jgi:hypothetical protein
MPGAVGVRAEAWWRSPDIGRSRPWSRGRPAALLRSSHAESNGAKIPDRALQPFRRNKMRSNSFCVSIAGACRITTLEGRARIASVSSRLGRIHGVSALIGSDAHRLADGAEPLPACWHRVPGPPRSAVAESTEFSSLFAGRDAHLADCACAVDAESEHDHGPNLVSDGRGTKVMPKTNEPRSGLGLDLARLDADSYPTRRTGDPSSRAKGGRLRSPVAIARRLNRWSASASSASASWG